MPIVVTTKTGDKGKTSLYSGERILKSDPRVEAYGTVDEVNSWLGVLRSNLDNKDLEDLIYKIQKKLFIVGSELATVDKELEKRITKEDVEFLEEKIEYFKTQSDLIEDFIVPGRSELEGKFNVTRTVVRRCERRIIAFSSITKSKLNENLLKYINRLSDLIYIMGRLDFENYSD